jgi:hypothetical protein
MVRFYVAFFGVFRRALKNASRGGTAQVCCWGFGKGRFAAWLIAIIWASKGEWYKLPLIGDFAEKTARG